MCVGIATNNQAEYDSVTGLLVAALHLGIRHLNVFLDSQLLVSQLNNYYMYAILVSLEISRVLDIWLDILNPLHSCMFP